MTSYLLAGPAEEPVSLAEAKAFLRLDDTAEDGLVTTLIAAARIHVESVTSRAMLTQTWRLVLDAWPAQGEVTLPIAPLITVNAAWCYDSAGEPHEIAVPEIVADTAGSRIWLPSQTGAASLRMRQAVEVDYTAGYGDEGTDVPADLRQAMLSLVAFWFERRDAVIVAGSGAVVPPGFDRVIAGYRRVRL